MMGVIYGMIRDNCGLVRVEEQQQKSGGEEGEEGK
jgi:hypothetical protein